MSAPGSAAKGASRSTAAPAGPPDYRGAQIELPEIVRRRPSDPAFQREIAPATWLPRGASGSCAGWRAGSRGELERVRKSSRAAARSSCARRTSPSFVQAPRRRARSPRPAPEPRRARQIALMAGPRRESRGRRQIGARARTARVSAPAASASPSWTSESARRRSASSVSTSSTPPIGTARTGAARPGPARGEQDAIRRSGDGSGMAGLPWRVSIKLPAGPWRHNWKTREENAGRGPLPRVDVLRPTQAVPQALRRRLTRPSRRARRAGAADPRAAGSARVRGQVPARPGSPPSPRRCCRSRWRRCRVDQRVDHEVMRAFLEAGEGHVEIEGPRLLAVERARIGSGPSRPRRRGAQRRERTLSYRRKWRRPRP